MNLGNIISALRGDVMICVGAMGEGEGRWCSVHWRDIISALEVFSALEDIISEFGKYYRCGTPAMH